MDLGFEELPPLIDEDAAEPAQEEDEPEPALDEDESEPALEEDEAEPALDEDEAGSDHESPMASANRNARLAAVLISSGKGGKRTSPSAAPSSRVSVLPGGRRKKLKISSPRRGVRSVRPKDGGEEPCYVCGKWFRVMPKNSKFCFRHKRVCDALVKKWRPKQKKGQLVATKVEDGPYAKEMACYRKVLKEKTLPPSAFSRMILDMMEQCPENSAGYRPMFNILLWVEIETYRTQLNKGFRAVYMHKTKYIRWITAEMSIDEEEARLRWLKRKQEVPEDHHLEDGPTDEPLRLPIVVEDYIDGSIGVMHDKQMQLQSKPQKLTSEQQIAEGREELTQGHLDFDADVFGSVAGGLTGSLNSRQKRGFNAVTGAAAVQAPGGNAAPQPATKKAKHFEVDTATVQIKTFIAAQVKKYKEGVQKTFELVAQVEDLAKVAVDVPELESYEEIMKRRASFLKIISITGTENDGGFADLGLQPFQLFEDEDYKVIVEYETVLKSFEDKKEDGDKLSVEQSNELGTKLKSIKQKAWRVSLLLRSFGFNLDDATFARPVKLTSMQGLFGKLSWSVKADALLLQAVKEAVNGRQALPLPNMDALGSVSGLEFDEATTKALDSEDEVKNYKKSAETQSKAMMDLIGKVNASANDAKRLINRKQADDDQRHDKEERRRAKEFEKAARKDAKVAQAKAKAAAKKKASKATEEGMQPALFRMPELPVVLTDMSNIAEVNFYADEAAMKSELPAEGVPYIVEKTPCKIQELLDERAVKANIGIYRIQAMDQIVIKETGRGQQPFQSDRKKRLAELLSTMVPHNTLPRVSGKLARSWSESANTLRIFAASESMVTASVERNALGNVRLHSSGKREILVVRFDKLTEIALAKHMVANPQEAEVDFMQRVLVSLKPSDFWPSDKTGDKIAVWKHVQLAGETMVVPPACFTVERTVPVTLAGASITKQERSDSFVIGFRMHYLESPESPAMKCLGELQKAHATRRKAADQTNVFWTTIMETNAKASSAAAEDAQSKKKAASKNS